MVDVTRDELIEITENMSKKDIKARCWTETRRGEKAWDSVLGKKYGENETVTISYTKSRR